ncbi:hypothetical protein ACV344_30925 [Pseudomonas aeruginosa]|uniref:hypothetical protein n=1 Tax=Pseudomonas aeruginosa TaxID=287 RepID=UPI000E680114|nr:hypothetical protein [Pseudomonas aeruginosa]MBA5106266.1 hypothetical protein [Pseudomonas aeruginosa]MBD1341603.1 hypothetical protein [Pseudomonas aeruginosa]MBG4604319.1 hypothetical protein [Pseudomonas aeruginosa]MBH3593033.1 hypothetical protein [Pseudomonas aeruginosa]MBH8258667.1 hypothetical protein [Pseudomonas aeruginosa]
MQTLSVIAVALAILGGSLLIGSITIRGTDVGMAASLGLFGMAIGGLGAYLGALAASAKQGESPQLSVAEPAYAPVQEQNPNRLLRYLIQLFSARK